MISAIFRALAEQKRRRDYLEARRRAELEALRTGRPVEPPQPEPSARQRLEELARKRRQAMARASGTQQAPTPTTPAQTPGRVRQIVLPGGIVLEIPEELTQTPQPKPAPGQIPSQPQQRSSARSLQSQPQAGRDTPARSRPSRQQPSRRTDHQPRQAMAPVRPPAQPRTEREQEPETQRTAAAASLLGAAPAAPPPAPKRLSITFPLSRTDWRRAVVLREVLDPPLALR
jgi:hypothetical protein